MRKGWEYKKLGEVTSFFRGLTYSGKDEVDKSNNIVLRSNNIDLSTNSLNFDELKFISDSITIPQDKKLRKNSIFMCMSNGSKQHLGKVAFIEKEYPYAFGGFMGLIVPNEDKLVPKFTYYYFCSQKFKAYLSAIGNGANINNIKYNDIAKDSIPLPPKSTQLAIVSELDKINELIRLKKEQLKDFDNLAQSLFYEMFGDPVENEKGWEAKKLGEIGEFKNGLNFSKDENGHSIKFLGVSDFQNKKSIASDQLDCISLSECVQEDYLLKTGDIVFVRSNGKKELIGRSVKMYITEPTTYSGFCIRCRITDEKVDKDYIAILLKTPIIRQFMTNSGRGCNISNLNQKILNSIPTILPPLPLQRLFAQRIEQIEREKSEVQKSIQDLETLLASRMQYWFE